MNVLFIGDIVGKPGRDILARSLPPLVARYDVHFTIANAENAAGGFGITRDIGDEILAAGVDMMTSGNHVWAKKEALPYIGAESRLIRPANYPSGAPGNGSYVGRAHTGRTVAVLNLMGRVFMPPVDDPFAAARREIEALRPRARIIVVDMHAEATSEKIAMGWFLDGQVSAVVGTHTHVQTADERILPGGTAFISDVGMTGPHDGVIGLEKEAALARFLTAMPGKHEVARGDPRLCAVVVEIDEESGRARDIERVQMTEADLT